MKGRICDRSSRSRIFLPFGELRSPRSTAIMERLGCEALRTRDPARQHDYLSKSLGIEVNDLHDENALVTEAGEVVVIDPVPMMEEASKLARLAAWRI